MTRAGERVKGATSARPFRGKQGGGAIPQPAWTKTGAQSEKTGRVILRKVFRARGWGVVKSLGSTWPENPPLTHAQIFSHSRPISERRAWLAATLAMVRQANALSSNGVRADRGGFFTAPELHRHGRRIEVRTEGTLRTPYQAGQFSADRAAGGCSHSPARLAGTVGTGSGPAAMQEIRACGFPCPLSARLRGWQ